jgi:hypothetical protein
MKPPSKRNAGREPGAFVESEKQASSHLTARSFRLGEHIVIRTCSRCHRRATHGRLDQLQIRLREVSGGEMNDADLRQLQLDLELHADVLQRALGRGGAMG